MKIIEVTWLDATGDYGWLTLEKLRKEKPIEHKSVGYLAHETKEFMTISMSYEPSEENMGAWLLIPRAYIKKITKLN